MTTAPDYAPGCYGSNIYFRTDATECVGCEFRDRCIAVVMSTQDEALVNVARFDKLFRTSQTVGVRKWWLDRWKPKKSVQRDLSRFNDLVAQWSSSDLNIFRLKHRDNPVKREDDPMLWETFQFIIDTGAFTAKDISEHLREKFDDLNKSKSLTYAQLICGSLAQVHVITKEKGVYCLTIR